MLDADLLKGMELNGSKNSAESVFYAAKDAQGPIKLLTPPVTSLIFFSTCLLLLDFSNLRVHDPIHWPRPQHPWQEKGNNSHAGSQWSYCISLQHENTTCL